MHRYKSGIFAVLLALCLLSGVVCTAPLTVSAANVSDWSSFVAEFNRLKDIGGSITLTGNITKTTTGTEELIASKLVTVITDSASIYIAAGTASFRTMKIEKSTNLAAITVQNGASLILNDSFISAQDLCLDIKSGGTATIGGGSIQTGAINGSVGIYVREGGTLIGTEDTKTSSVAYVWARGQACYGIYCEGTFKSVDSEIYSDGTSSTCVWIAPMGSADITYCQLTAAGLQSVAYRNYGTTVMNDCRIEGGSAGVYAVGGTFTLNNGTVDAIYDYSNCIQVFDGATAIINGGELYATSNVIYAQSRANVVVNGGTLSVPMSGSVARTGIEIESSAQVTINGSTVVSGLQYGINVKAGGILNINGGLIKANRYAVVGAGDINVYGGIICGYASDTTGIGINASGKLRVYGGDIRGNESALHLTETSDTVIYKGRLSNDGLPPVDPGGVKLMSVVSDISVVMNPSIVIYSAVSWNKNVKFYYDPITNYFIRQSFEITDPLTVNLILGESKTVNFTVKGEKPDGTLITIQDLLGASGTLDKVTYTVSGSSVTFVPKAEGSDTLTVIDNVTYNGQWQIGITVANPLTNIAAGKNYTYTGTLTDVHGNIRYPDTNYSELTDGVTGSKADIGTTAELWCGLSSVGYGTDTVNKTNNIIVNLGKTENRLTQFVLTAEECTGTVHKPLSVEVFVSNNNIDYISLGFASEAMIVDAENEQFVKYGIYSYTLTPTLPASAKFVKFVIAVDGNWAFVSEVQVFRNPNATDPQVDIAGAVSISGTNEYGATLTADTTGITPANADVAYQWYCNGSEIVDATSKTYSVAAADIGSSMTVVVTGINNFRSTVISSGVMIGKASRQAPGIPVLSSKNNSKIVLNAIEGCEYKIKSGEWQSNAEFAGLMPDTEYSFCMRYKESTTYKVSPESEVLKVRTDSCKITFDNGYATGLTEKMTYDDVVKIFSGSFTVKAADGTVITGSVYIGTGSVISYNGNNYTVVIKGDVSGDGIVDSGDYLLVKKACIGNINLSDIQLKAACLSGDPFPSSIDCLKIKKHIIGTGNLYK